MRQQLIIDADDTLWENNIYFEQAFDAFFEHLNHSSLTPADVRAALDEIELANIRVNGYGARNFGRNMCVCFQHLAERQVSDDDLERITELAEKIIEQPIEIIEGVPETLEYLASRHDLTLFTKGHSEEQKLKIDRSGLGVWFGHTAIVREKNKESFALLVADRNLDPGGTWMIGNSPKSDINPALAAGLNAVFVPHARTWHLEQTELSTGPGKLLQVGSFADLKRFF